MATVADEKLKAIKNNETAVVSRLTEPWESSDQIIFGNLYFCFLETCEQLDRIGLRYIGVVKTATRRYPMGHLSIEMSGWRDQRSLREDLDVEEGEH